MSKRELLKELENFEKEYLFLTSNQSLLYTDMVTHMPRANIGFRIEQYSYFESLIDKKLTSKKFVQLLKKLKKEKLSKKETKRVEVWNKKVIKNLALPSDFNEKYIKQIGITNNTWEIGRVENSSKKYLKEFSILQNMLLQKITFLKKKFKFEHPYDYLIDDFEEGMSTKDLEEPLSNLKEFILDSLKKLKKSKHYRKKPYFKHNLLTEDQQRKITEFIIDKMIVEKDRFSYTTSTHPFTTPLGLNDIRITTAFRNNFLFSIMGTIHESGHALYELGIKKVKTWNILKEAPSLGIHESQSRFWENYIGENKEFTGTLYKYIKKQFPKEFSKISKDDFYREINRIRPGLERLESDELTYGLHIIIRFELERDLFDGKIDVKNIEKEWNKKYKEYLGVIPKHVKEGFMQDVHWSQGSIGYFPTYLLGSIWASMFFRQMKKDLGEKQVSSMISKLEFDEIREWLYSNIHQYGNEKTTKEIVIKVCGEYLNIETYKDYLREKYSTLYNVEL